METSIFPPSIEGLSIYMVGAKGTGMTALAEILHNKGAKLTGSDVPDVFYTDSILHSLGIRVYENFDASHVTSDIDIVIHSAAYSLETNPELKKAHSLAIPIFNYPEALGALSRHSRSAGIAGVHGKTTTTAMAGILIEALSIPASVLAGSAIANFNGHCTLIAGDTYFVAETCEYRKHFLNFQPSWIVLTSVESDHQDFFPTYESIRDAFIEYAMSLPPNGSLIFCADQKGAVEVADIVLQKRKDIQFVEYGFLAQGRYKIREYTTSAGENTFVVGDTPVPLTLHMPGRHLVLDAVAAIALVESLFKDQTSSTFGTSEWRSVEHALSRFRGSKRRSEIVGEFNGVLIIDDYGHHPTAIKTTIDGIKQFWPHRRLIIDFMSHTYSRTIALQDEFVASLDAADAVILHKIYASARETPIPGFSGATLFEKLRMRRPEVPSLILAQSATREKYSTTLDHFVAYSEEPLEALDFLAQEVRPGDIVLTMGAGDNWKLGIALAEILQKNDRSHTDGELQR